MKNSAFSLSMLMILMLGLGAYNQNLEESTLELDWQDEFDDNLLNEKYWTRVIGDGCPNLCGWGNNELQYYRSSQENVRVENGILIIEAHKNNFRGREFTSAKLVTKDKVDWKYGKIEVRAKLPQGLGSWPAIWMLPTVAGRSGQWPQDGEIDIMEHVGYNQGMIYGTIHTDKYNGMQGTHKSDSIYIEDAHTSFHNYSIEWTQESITWSVDDRKYYTLKREKEGVDGWPFNQFRYHLIINLAVGGNWGGKNGVDLDIWPQRLEIDHVRYYK